MKLDDFCYFHRGTVTALLPAKEAGLLEPIKKEGNPQERVLLLLHGFSSSPAVYRHMLPMLSMYDNILCPVLPGHGESIEALSKVTAQDWVDCAMRHCETLLQTYSTVDVMGLSLGGLLAYHLSHHFPLNHLYLLAPALYLHLNVPLMLRLARVLHAFGLRRIRNHAGNLRSKTFSELAYRHVPIHTSIQILKLIQQVRFTLPTCPVDLFLGRYDEVVDNFKVAQLFQNAPQARIHWLENSAHILPLDGDVDAIIQCMTEHF